MQVLFWLLFFGVGYSYFIYPLLLVLLPSRQILSAKTMSPTLPLITIIIPAHNEATRIVGKLDNTLALDYPSDKLQVIIASDASTDDTDTLAESYFDRGVSLVRSEVRRGKEFAQALAIQRSSGEIFVFSDMSTVIPPDSLHKLVKIFSCSTVGAVSSEDVIIDSEGRRTGESSYVRYEMWLRRLESKVSGVIGLSGSFFAARCDVCQQWDYLVPGDFNVAINCAELGRVAISSPDVIGLYKEIVDGSREYQRKLRTAIHGFSAVSQRVEVLNPFRYGFFSFQVWSHKIMRWLVPWFALSLFMVNATLLGHDGYCLLFGLQLAFYFCAIAGFASPRLREMTLFKIPYFFVQVNAALLHAALLFLKGERMTAWEPSVR